MTKKIFSLLLVICLISISALPATAQPDISMYSYLEGGAAPDQHPEDETTEPAATPSTTEDTTTPPESTETETDLTETDPPESTETETDLTETEPAPIAAASAEAPAKRIGTFGIEPNRIDMFAAPSGNQPAKIVADNHVLMTRADGRFFVWGDNTYGQLGLGAGAPTKVYTPTENTFFSDKGLKIKDIYVIEDVSFILCSNGELYGFGKGLNGRLGLGSTSNVNTPTLIPGSQNLRIEKLYGGKEFMLAATGNNEIYGWGRNNFGQVGNNTKVDVLSPTLIMSNADISNLEVGDDFAMLIKQGKSVHIWGNNAGGRLGFDTTVNKSASNVTAPACINPTPTPCTHSSHPSNAGCKAYAEWYPRHESCAGTWALNEAGYQGTKGAATMTVTMNSFISPQKIVTGAGRNFTSLATIASTWIPTGTANGITNNIYKFISTANCTHNHNRSFYQDVNCLPMAKSVTRSYTHTWQYELPNAYQYFDTAHTTDLQLGNKHGVVSINNVYYGWGDNTLKQQGTSGNANGYMVPLTQINTYINQLNSGEGFSSLHVEGDTNYIISGTGNVSVWGSNANGKAGIDSAASYIDTPTIINALDGKAVATVVAGRNHTFAITHTGDVYAIGGDNLYGQCGLGDDYADVIKITSPVLIETFKFSEAAVAPDAPDSVDSPDEVEAGTDFEIQWTNVSAKKFELVRVHTPDDNNVMTFADPVPSEEVVYIGDQTTFTDTVHEPGKVHYKVRSYSFVDDRSPWATSTDTLILPSSNTGGDDDNGNNNNGNNNNNNGGSGVDKEYLDYILSMFTKMTESQQQFVIEYLRNNGVSDELIAAILAASKKNNSGDVNVTVPGMDKDTAALIAAGMQESNGNSGQTGAPTTNVYNQPSDLSGLAEFLGAYGMEADQPEALSGYEQLARAINLAVGYKVLEMFSPAAVPEVVPTVAPVQPAPVYQAESTPIPLSLTLALIIGLIVTMGGLMCIRLIPKKE